MLVVGANGFGCELLIDLALSGFQNLMVIGIDRIEVINQAEKNPVPFFFKNHHTHVIGSLEDVTI